MTVFERARDRELAPPLHTDRLAAGGTIDAQISHRNPWTERAMRWLWQAMHWVERAMLWLEARAWIIFLGMIASYVTAWAVLS